MKSEDRGCIGYKELIIFIHIPKTGGATTRSILSKNYKEHFLDAMLHGRRSANGGCKTAISLDYDVECLISRLCGAPESLECIAINLPFGVHAFLRRPTIYITFLRDPVARCISFWNEAYRFRLVSNTWSILEGFDFDIDEILLSKAVPELINDQTRMLSGSGEFDCTRKDLDAAEFNISSGKIIAGSLDTYDIDIEAMSSIFYWNTIEHEALNRSDPYKQPILPTNFRQKIMEANDLDVELVKWNFINGRRWPVVGT